MADKTSQDSELREAFNFNDRDGNGLIDFLEFVAMLDGLEAGIDTPTAQIGFKTIDTDGDGMVNFTEFAQWWQLR